MKKIKIKEVVKAANSLSLGISVVVAILIGLGLGIYFQNRFNSTIYLFIGLFLGISAGILNVYKAYKQHKLELDELKDDPKYSYKNKQ